MTETSPSPSPYASDTFNLDDKQSAALKAIQEYEAARLKAAAATADNPGAIPPATEDAPVTPTAAPPTQQEALTQYYENLAAANGLSGAGAGSTGSADEAWLQQLAQQVQFGTTANDPPILRSHGRDSNARVSDSWTPLPPKTAPLSEFEGEYWMKTEDPAFLDWATKRALPLGYELLDKDGNFDRAMGWKFWQYIGAATASNPLMLESMTPEDFANGQYEQAGGDAMWNTYMDQRAIALEKQRLADMPKNPIQTLTQTNRTTMNKGAAEASVDDLARGLLGRMASEKELTRYRKAINAFLASNPSVSTTTTDSTNPDAVTMNTVTKDGASAQDAVNVLEMRLRRSSEGQAYNVGTAFEQALAGMDKGL